MVPNQLTTTEYLPWLRWLAKLIWAPGGEGWDPRSRHARARLACPLGNTKDALDTIT